MNNPIFIDCETVGLYGVPVLIQYAVGNGEIVLHAIWDKPISDTMQLIERFCNHDDGLVFFNAAFDWFHLCKIYTIFNLYPDKDAIPRRIIHQLADLEQAAMDGPCLRPKHVLDLFLHARKTSYQSLMERSDIRIKRVPTALAWQLATELENRIQIKDIYFARKKNKLDSKWKVYDIKDDEDNINPDFKDVVLKFAASSALKALAIDALKLPVEEVLRFSDVEINKKFFPEELGYAPYAKALDNNRNTWPYKISEHITHWMYHEIARKYASDDIKYTRGLYNFFGCPEMDDDDSILACAVAACRWRGYKIDIPKLQQLRQQAIIKIAKTPTAPKQVRYYVSEYLSETERLIIRNSTKKTILETIAKLLVPCPDCNADAESEIVNEQVSDYIIEEFDAPEVIINTVITGGKKDCQRCGGLGSIKHPAAIRAEEVLEARKSQKKIELYDKLILAGRFHVSAKIIGALSGRMSGADDLNFQGIDKSKEVRRCFPLAWEDMELYGGDYAGFEITLAEACYNDLNLRKDLLTCEYCGGEMVRVNESVLLNTITQDKELFKQRRLAEEIQQIQDALKKGKEYKQKSFTEIDNELVELVENDFICTVCGSNTGKKIHALFGTHVYPDMTYEQIKATSGTSDDKYTRCKSAVFAMCYGGEGPTLQDRLGVELEIANKAFEAFGKKYPGVAVARKRIINKFQSMKQPNGIGTQVVWEDPADYIESMLGFRRYFTLENMICKALFDLANKPPKTWRDIKVKVNRRDRVQTAGGAVQSALYAAAFNLQSSNMRAAANHEIQSTGAQITKKTQRNIWELQPVGINKWFVMPMNIHDEIQCPCRPEISNKVKEVVNTTVESFRTKVPLIKMDWSQNLKTWADK